MKTYVNEKDKYTMIGMTKYIIRKIKEYDSSILGLAIMYALLSSVHYLGRC